MTSRRVLPLGRWKDWVGVGREHVERMENEDFAKNVYLSSVE